MSQKKQFHERPKRVALFVTCMVDMMYPNVGLAAVELLERFGVEVIFPDDQTCCGQPAFNAGFREDARSLARRFVHIFEPLVQSGFVDAVVAPSGSCTTMTSHFYASLLANDPLQARAQTLAEVTFELTEFLVDVLKVQEVSAHFEGKITYHACCHLLRELRVDQQPRLLLATVQDAELVELAGAADCCGFGGLFSIKNSQISTAMGERKIRNLATSGADVVTMCDVSCMTHINGLLEKQSQRCRAVHIAEVLNRQSEAASEAPRSPLAPQTESDLLRKRASRHPEPKKPRRWQDF